MGPDFKVAYNGAVMGSQAGGHKTEHLVRVFCIMRIAMYNHCLKASQSETTSS